MEGQDKNSNTIAIFVSLIVIAIVGAAVGFGYVHIANSKQKAPYEKILKTDGTDVKIETSYNDKYGIVRLNLIIDEVVEDWQIQSIDDDKTYINMICETKDKTVKKEYYFADVSLIKGEKIKATLVMEDSSLKDYIMLKDLLNGEIKLDISDYLTLDTDKRANLQQEFYDKQIEEKEKEKEAEKAKTQQKAPTRTAPASSSFLDNLFNF